MTERKQVRAVISGEVQGVWFRAWTEEQAQSLRLQGWVRNCKDGTVEAIFAGPADAVEEMLKRCEDGPPMARVKKVTWQEDTSGVEGTFSQAPDV